MTDPAMAVAVTTVDNKEKSIEIDDVTGTNLSDEELTENLKIIYKTLIHILHLQLNYKTCDRRSFCFLLE